jgi:hypothetical protein
MHDWLGIGLIALGLGLVAAGIVKHRSRRRTVLVAGAIRPEFASMGEIVRPLVLFCVGFIALKMSLFYFLFGGDRLLTSLDYAGLMFVLAAYCGYLVAATSKRREVVADSREVGSSEAKWAA